MPKNFIEKCIHTIGSRSLCWSHLKQRRFNFFTTKRPGKHLKHIICSFVIYCTETFLHFVTSAYIKNIHEITKCHLSHILNFLHPNSIIIFNSLNKILLPSLRGFGMKKFSIPISMFFSHDTRDL